MREGEENEQNREKLIIERVKIDYGEKEKRIKIPVNEWIERDEFEIHKKKMIYKEGGDMFFIILCQNSLAPTSKKNIFIH